MALIVLTLAALGCVEVRREVQPATPSGGQGGGVQDLALRWDRLPVRYCLDLGAEGYESDGTFESLTMRAFETWGVATEYEGRCDGELAEHDGTNQIGWGAPPNEDVAPGVYEAGFTRIRFRECRGGCDIPNEATLVEADVIIDDGPPLPYRNERCLYSVLLHEIGHMLGLPHIEAPAVMSAVSTSCRQELTERDFDALYERYPERRPAGRE